MQENTNQDRLLEIAGDELRRLQAEVRRSRVMFARQAGLLAIVSFLGLGWGVLGAQIAQWAFR